MKMWLSDLSIRQPVFITMLVAAVLITGGLFYSRMAMDLLPDASLPIVAVQTVYPGADPQEVERSVTKPIEDEVVSINGVESIRSSSMDSVSLVVIEFSMETDPKRAFDDVRDRINIIRNALPSDIDEPLIHKMDMSASAMMTIAIADASGVRSPEELRTIVDDVIKPRIERVNGVASAEITGGRVRQIHVDLRLDRLKAYAIPPYQVLQAIHGENLDVPGGRISNGRAEELVRTEGRVRSLEQLANLSVPTLRGSTIKLKELADISEGYEEVRSISRLNSSESVVAEVRKQSGTNLVQVADGVKKELELLKQQYPDLRFGIAYDQSTYTRQSVHDVQISLLLGGILAAFVVYLFFRDVLNTLVTVAGLPVVVFGTFGVLYSMGFTLNIVTLMALSISIGMLIDDAIVVRENIFRHMERGEEPKVAAGRGTAEIALAVLAVTSTIVAVFLPIAFVGGVTGRFLREFGLTVVVAVVISLIEAFTFAPMLSAYLFQRIDPSRNGASSESRFLAFFETLNRGYRSLLAWALDHRRWVVLVSVVSFAASVLPLPLMSRSFLPVVDQGEFRVVVELPASARLEDTDRAAQAAEDVLLKDPEVEQLFTMVGAAEGTVDKATLYVELKSLGKTDEVIERVRPQLLSTITGAKVMVEKQATTTALFGGSMMVGSVRGRPIQFSVEGPDMAEIDRISTELMAKLQQVPGITDVNRSIKEGRPQRVITLDRNRATDLGVSTSQAGATVRTLINGEVAGSYRDKDKDIDILVRLAEADRNDPEKILQLPVFTSRGEPLPLSAVASVAPSVEPNSIDRQNRQRQILVGGGFVGRDMGNILEQAREAAKTIPLPEGTTIRLAGDAKYMDEAFDSLNMAIILSVAFVYMILASQFGSFIHPITIMLALPFSLVGALTALLVGRFSLDMLAMIGMILLMGLVAKNSILLVEFINQLRRRGLDVREAILEAGPVRLRPILMTTLAMIFGMIPVAVGFGAGAELRQPMGISVIGGLVTSTLLTLIAVPVAYSLIDELGQKVSIRFKRKQPVPEPET
ncbi:MAG: efflux RND transporter permease subunit [Chloroflexota bacterium]|jgi:HAE1 family hydrophobic/amphiphilic exporter-1